MLPKSTPNSVELIRDRIVAANNDIPCIRDTFSGSPCLFFGNFLSAIIRPPEINIIGNSARFNHKTQHLQLESDIVISSNKNVGVLIESIKIDLQKKIISSPRPVKIAYEDICIEGKNFEINNNGDKIKFTDGVNLIIGENTLCITS